MKKNWAFPRGKNFFAFGWGKRGPYAVATRRIGHRTYAKASVGTLGPRVGGKYSGRRVSAEGRINLSTGKPSFSFKRKRRSSYRRKRR